MENIKNSDIVVNTLNDKYLPLFLNKCTEIFEEWINSGFSHKETYNWLIHFYKSKLNSQEAYDWLKNEFSPDECAFWRNYSGLNNPIEARKWRELGFTVDSVSKLRKLGVYDFKEALTNAIFGSLYIDSGYAFSNYFNIINTDKKDTEWFFSNEKIILKTLNKSDLGDCIIVSKYKIDCYSKILESFSVITDYNLFKNFGKPTKKSNINIDIKFRYNSISLYKETENLDFPIIETAISNQKHIIIGDSYNPIDLTSFNKISDCTFQTHNIDSNFLNKFIDKKTYDSAKISDITQKSLINITFNNLNSFGHLLFKTVFTDEDLKEEFCENEFSVSQNQYNTFNSYDSFPNSTNSINPSHFTILINLLNFLESNNLIKFEFFLRKDRRYIIKCILPENSLGWETILFFIPNNKKSKEII